MYFRLVFISIFILSLFLKNICSGNRFLGQQLIFFYHSEGDTIIFWLPFFSSSQMSTEILILLLMTFFSIFKINFLNIFYYEMGIVFFVHICLYTFIVLLESWNIHGHYFSIMAFVPGKPA